MHEEWGHLQLTVRDRKRHLAAEAVQQQACGEAIEQILSGICQAVRGYSLGHKDGQKYYQKIQDNFEDGVIIITGRVELGHSAGQDGLQGYCDNLMQEHADKLTAIMADGTDDLITDLCITTAAECTREDIGRIPDEGLPRRLHRGALAS